MTEKKSNYLPSILFYIFSALICLFSIIPIIWGISTSLKPENEILAFPPVWIPKNITFSHYIEVLTDASMLKYFKNTVIIAFGSTVISLIVAILGAYGFSRYKFPGKSTLLWSILFTRILPRVSVLVPFYIILNKLRLSNTYAGLILVYVLVTMPLAVWLLKGFFDGIPYEIEEAAAIDGCSPLRILIQIIIPIATPSIASVGTYAFILAWNEFLFSLVMSNDSSTRTISVGLNFYIDEFGVHWGPLMAASILMSIPSMIVFSITQKRMVSGLSEGAVKG